MVNEEGETCCDACGVRLRIGQHPFCPHGDGGSAIERDDIPGGLTVENYGPTPITFYSHSERRKYMLEHGLREIEKYCPKPGSDIDPAGIPNPDGYKDPQTLANAAALICRNGQAEAPFDPGSVMRVHSGKMTNDEAIRIQHASK